MYDRASEQLTPVLLDFELEQAIRANDDAAIRVCLPSHMDLDLLAR